MTTPITPTTQHTLTELPRTGHQVASVYTVPAVAASFAADTGWQACWHIDVTLGHHTGDQVPIWIDANGELTSAPLAPDDAYARAELVLYGRYRLPRWPLNRWRD
ncbi:hypothetical protein GCM10010174_07520 [Kutzneria viridogrisea]|uniref:Uncharacterized protein n=2 Tax=Kutzneria TaxID=43356 RepID=W5W991_9PSEU|nr:hypothetical protein [Kutzneria albida]AHH97527.1 hypothetical protein KALB_4163 [Kutzneria albida DSM 43870]MBA8930535.1 hypothetical protein [Kutzneria viridogrisea]